MKFLRNEMAGEVDWELLRKELDRDGLGGCTPIQVRDYVVFSLNYPQRPFGEAPSTALEADVTYFLRLLSFLERRGFRFIARPEKILVLFRIPEMYVVEVFDCNGKTQRRRQDRGRKCTCQSR